MSNVFDFPLMLEQGAERVRKRARTAASQLGRMPELTKHGMESRFATDNYPHIDANTSNLLQADNGIHNSAINPVVTTISVYNGSAEPQPFTHGRFYHFIPCKVPFNVSNNAMRSHKWVAWKDVTSSSKTELLLVAEDVVIKPNSCKVITIEVYGPVVVKGDKDGSDASQLQFKHPTNAVNVVDTRDLIQGKTYIVDTPNSLSMRMGTISFIDELPSKVYMVLHPPNDYHPIFGVYEANP
jgi:hypothetical protein